ncbi:hydrogenase 3 maturation endopeptidase HyCI [Verrucomicrobiota bacterium]
MGTIRTGGIEPSESCSPSTLYSLLSTSCKGKTCILGVGNRMKGDDGAGPMLIDRIAGRVKADCVDAGIVPENFLEKIIRMGPDTVLIVDALNFSGTPGDIRVLKPDAIASGGISSHALSLRMTCDYLNSRSRVSVHIVGIQPASTELGQEELSPQVSNALDTLCDCLRKILPCE